MGQMLFSVPLSAANNRHILTRSFENHAYFALPLASVRNSVYRFLSEKAFSLQGKFVSS